jgi:hypothetical protein
MPSRIEVVWISENICLKFFVCLIIARLHSARPEEYIEECRNFLQKTCQPAFADSRGESKEDSIEMVENRLRLRGFPLVVLYDLCLSSMVVVGMGRVRGYTMPGPGLSRDRPKSQAP